MGLKMVFRKKNHFKANELIDMYQVFVFRQCKKLNN